MQAYEIIKMTKTRYSDKGRKCWCVLNQNSIREGLVERLTAAGISVKVDEKVLEQVVREGNQAKEVDFWLLALPEHLQAIFRAYV
ncbi:MAG: hypothetical protein RMJ87_00675 [Cytophagales bacterium]|nr:hypothetical protein [Bernardetiaceae bacterium]MDW8203515.1 hypothetical protein [Cytophagales bacterium]